MRIVVTTPSVVYDESHGRGTDLAHRVTTQDVFAIATEATVRVIAPVVAPQAKTSFARCIRSTGAQRSKEKFLKHLTASERNIIILDAGIKACNFTLGWRCGLHLRPQAL